MSDKTKKAKRNPILFNLTAAIHPKRMLYGNANRTIGNNCSLLAILNGFHMEMILFRRYSFSVLRRNVKKIWPQESVSNINLACKYSSFGLYWRRRKPSAEHYLCIDENVFSKEYFISVIC